MKRALLIALLVMAGGLTTPAVAQRSGVQYKWQTQDGTTVYSDLPPGPDAKLMKDRPVEQPRIGPVQADESAASQDPPSVPLPYTLRITSVKSPVVLYTTDDCAPCTAARAHLAARGIPFREESVTTSSDVEVFKARGFSDNRFPGLTVGGEKTVGFESGAYDRLLDAAGYPRTSMLPPGYRQAAATPAGTGQPQRPAGGGSGEWPTANAAGGAAAGAPEGAAPARGGTAGATAAAGQSGGRAALGGDGRGTAPPDGRGAAGVPTTRF